MSFERFDSIDGILRPSVFQQPEDADWPHIVNESFMLHYFADREYAERKRAKMGRGDLVGVGFHEHNEAAIGFLGYDLIDGYNDVSLLTNWGNAVGVVNRNISKTGLIQSRAVIEEIRDELLRCYGGDSHVAECKIVSVYRTDANDQPARVFAKSRRFPTRR